MKFSLQQLTSQASVLSTVILLGVQPAEGHYGFPFLVVNGIRSKWFEFVRPVGLDSYNQQFFPSYDWTGESQVCGINGTKTGYQISTATVEAGSVIGFGAAPATYEIGPISYREFDPENDYIGHRGPGQIYMSKAPGALEDYEGDGEWFKVASTGASDGFYWDTDGKREINATIPKTTPPGKYLVRVEHYNISPYYNGTQQFINCAHIEVTGPGGGVPGPTIKFPGGYDISDPGIWLPRMMWQPPKPTELLKKFKGAGPAVWTG